MTRDQLQLMFKLVMKDLIEKKSNKYEKYII